MFDILTKPRVDITRKQGDAPAEPRNSLVNHLCRLAGRRVLPEVHVFIAPLRLRAILRSDRSGLGAGLMKGCRKSGIQAFQLLAEPRHSSIRTPLNRRRRLGHARFIARLRYRFGPPQRSSCPPVSRRATSPISSDLRLGGSRREPAIFVGGGSCLTLEKRLLPQTEDLAFLAMKRVFDVVIERDPTSYLVASVPTLPGCHTRAKSLDKFQTGIREAIELCLEECG